MTGQERIELSEALALQRAAIDILHEFRVEQGEMRDEMRQWRSEIIEVVKEMSVRVDKLEDDRAVEVATAAAVGAVVAKKDADKQAHLLSRREWARIMVAAGGVAATCGATAWAVLQFVFTRGGV